MSLNALEVAVYVLVLMGANPEPFTCESSAVGVRCSNGVAVFPSEADGMVFSNGVRLAKINRSLVFSNGINTYMDAAGWVQFSNGVGVRRERATRYRFTNNMICEETSESAAICRKR